MTWPTKKLGDLLTSCDAGVWGKPAMSGKGLFILRSTNMTNDGHLDFSDVAERKIEGDIKKVKLSDGDILIEKSGGGPDQPVGRVAHFTAPNDRAYSFANFIQRLRVKSELIDSSFLFYRLLFLHKIGFTKKLQSQTTGIRNLKLSLYLKTEIPLPPLPIQKQIVERLDKIAEAQKLNNELIQKSDELFQSLLHQELNPTGKDWETRMLGDCMIQFDRGISWSRKDEGGTVAVLRIPNIKEGEINVDDLKHIDTKNENGKLEKDDIVMVASNGNPDLVGRSALVTEREAGMRFASFLVKLRLEDKKLSPLYAHLFLLTPLFKRELRRKIATTSGIYNLRKEHVEKIKISLPPLQAQKQIVAKLSAVQEYKKQLLEQKAKLKELFNSALAKSFSEKSVK